MTVFVSLNPILNGGCGGWGGGGGKNSPPKKIFFEMVKNLRTKFFFTCLLKISIKNHAYLSSYSHFVKCLRHTDSRICVLLLLYETISLVFYTGFLYLHICKKICNVLICFLRRDDVT